jgi:glycosyltransferase involved in cell wall biosynthesis
METLNPMQALPVSCFIIAKNEADRIGRTIASVRDLVAEIVVIDSGSTDGTQAIAETAGARVCYNPWPGFGQQKRFGEDQCSHDWLLNLDADEVVPTALAIELRNVFATGQPAVAGFWVNDLIVYPGRTVPRPFARDHRFVRLYDRRRVRFADSTLFDNVETKGQPIGVLRHPMYHYTVRSLDDLIAKNDERARYNATFAKRKSRTVLALRLVTEFPLSFFKYYFWRTHLFGGLLGFQYAVIMAFYRFVRIVRLHARSLVVDAADAKAPAVADLNTSRVTRTNDGAGQSSAP